MDKSIAKDKVEKRHLKIIQQVSDRFVSHSMNFARTVSFKQYFMMSCRISFMFLVEDDDMFEAKEKQTMNC